MTVDEIIKHIENGEPFRVSFEKRTVLLNGSFISEIEFVIPSNPKDKLIELYRNYKSSVPSARTDSRYFIGLDESQLSTKELVENESRYIARAKLELYVLGLIINDKWDFGDKWYWQSKEEPKLVLFKKWFENHKEN